MALHPAGAVKGKAGNPAPIAIGFTVGACLVVFGPLTGSSLNPARTPGPAVATGNYADIRHYMVATLGGAALAVLYNRRFAAWTARPATLNMPVRFPL